MPIPDPTLPFTLHGCWEVWEKMDQPKSIRRMIDLLEHSVFETPALAFDTAKALVESTCKTVLTERSSPVNPLWDIPKLLKEALKAIDLVPDGYEGEAAELMRQIAGGLQNAVKNLGELRTKEGLVGHGRDAFSKQLETTHAMFAAKAADTVVHFLYMAHLNYPTVTATPSLSLEDNPDFNQHVDDLHEVFIFDGVYSASEVLFRVDPEAYRDSLANFRADQALEEGEP